MSRPLVALILAALLLGSTTGPARSQEGESIESRRARLQAVVRDANRSAAERRAALAELRGIERPAVDRPAVDRPVGGPAARPAERPMPDLPFGNLTLPEIARAIGDLADRIAAREERLAALDVAFHLAERARDQVAAGGEPWDLVRIDEERRAMAEAMAAADSDTFDAWLAAQPGIERFLEAAEDRLLRSGADELTESDLVRLANAWAAEHNDGLGELERWRDARDQLEGEEARRTDFLGRSDRAELEARRDELEDWLADRSRRPFGLEREGRQRELAEIERELSGRAATSQYVEDEILPALDGFRRALADAADDERVDIAETLTGREPLFDSGRDWAVREEALAEDSLFNRIRNLPRGAARTAAVLAYLDAVSEFSETVGGTLEAHHANIVDPISDSRAFNNGLRADLRVKAAALLSEETAEILALTNDPKAPAAWRDRSGERLTRRLRDIFYPGFHTVGGVETGTRQRIQEYLAIGIADLAAETVAGQRAVDALRESDPSSEALRRAEESAVQSAEDLGMFLGALEAGEALSADRTESHRQAQEETLAAFFDVAFGAARAPIPGAGALVRSKTLGKVIDSLQGSAGSIGKDAAWDLLEGESTGGPEADLRRNIRDFRDLTENLLGTTRVENVLLTKRVHDARHRVANDRLNRSE